MSVTFKAKVKLEGKTATGIEVPLKMLAALGDSKRLPVTVTINGYTYRSTVMSMRGAFMVPLAAEHRTAAQVGAGETISVTLTADTAPRAVPVPKDLASALKKTAGARAAFDALAFTYRKEHVRALEDAKTPETRARRLDKIMAALAAKKK